LTPPKERETSIASIAGLSLIVASSLRGGFG